MSSFTLQELSKQTDAFRRLIAEHPYTAVSTAVTILLSRYIARDYEAWLSIEAGGLPHNFWGYTAAKIVTTQASPDLLSTSLYSKAMTDSVKNKQYIEGEIPIRAGQAPVMSQWAAPVRQLSSHAAQTDIQALDKIIDSTVARHPSACFRAPSEQEGGKCSALWIRRSCIPGGGRPTRHGRQDALELYHYHGFDGSAHLTVSPADARYLLDRGWGIRHALSGQHIFGLRKLLPVNFIMLYAPRSEEECRVHELVAGAAVEYALAGGNWA